MVSFSQKMWTFLIPQITNYVVIFRILININQNENLENLGENENIAPKPDPKNYHFPPWYKLIF